MSGFDTGIELLLSIYGDSTNFIDFKDTINENIENIALEEVVILKGGDSIYVGWDENYNLIGDTQKIYFPFYHITTELNSNIIRVIEAVNSRKSANGDFTDNELIYNKTLANGQTPSLNSSGGTTTVGAGVISTTRQTTFGNTSGDTLSGRFNSTNTSELYFSNSVSNTSLNNLIPGKYYKISTRIRLRNATFSNVSLNFYEYNTGDSIGDTKITSVTARDTSEWQELVIFKGLDYEATGASFSIKTTGNLDFDDISVKQVGDEIIAGSSDQK